MIASRYVTHSVHASTFSTAAATSHAIVSTVDYNAVVRATRAAVIIIVVVAVAGLIPRLLVRRCIAAKLLVLPAALLVETAER